MILFENAILMGQHVIVMTMLVAFVIFSHVVVLDALLGVVENRMSGTTKVILQATITLMLIAHCGHIVWLSIESVIEHTGIV